MDNKKYKYYVCKKDFSDVNSRVSHLRIIHNVKEKTESVKCILNLKCENVFQTFEGMKRHLNKCPRGETEVIVEINLKKKVFIFHYKNLYFYVGIE